LEKRSQGYFVFKEGTLYPALRRLERKGLVISKWEIIQSGRKRRYYYITDRGAKFLQDKKAEWQGFSSALNLIAGLP
jgi:DNA-binding PadR family transcriptional regulator